MSNDNNKVVMYNGSNQHSFSAKADCLVTLNAGKNVVSISKLDMLTGKTGDKEKDKCKSLPFIEMMEDGVIEIIDDAAVVVAKTVEKENTAGIKKPSDDTIEINIVALGTKEAKTVINAEIEVSVIKGYLDAENADDGTRKAVVDACEKAIALLEKPADSE